MKLKITLLVATLLTGCDSQVEIQYETTVKGYTTEKESVVAFFEDNREVLQELTNQQEMLGWVVKCSNLYYNTNSKIGTLYNIIDTSEISLGRGCEVTANIHTHTIPPKEKTADVFSEADLKASKRWNMYLLAQENCTLRMSKGRKWGVRLGKIENCNG